MNNAIDLTLMIGPVVPIPVPRDVLSALVDVEVKTASGKPSGFQLRFTLSTKSPLHTLFLLSGGSPIPLVRVIIIVTINATPQVLMDGIVTNHEIQPGEKSGQAMLVVTGEDLSRVMDYIDFTGMLYPAMPTEARVALIIAKYAIFGILPIVIPSVMFEIPNPTDRIPAQKGTDLCYIKQLADEVGYVFYVDPGPVPGTSTGYWGPEIKVGSPQSPLNIDMDSYTNVESLTFNLDTESATTPVVYYVDETTKVTIPIPVPDISPLSPPLGLIRPLTKNFTPIPFTSKYSPIRTAVVALTKAAKSSDVVKGQGTLDVTRYGKILKARKLVSVRGAGTAFDGLHYVTSVTHKIKRGEYKQNFTLSRNGIISTLQKVPV